MKKIIIVTVMAITGWFLLANQALAGVAEKRMHHQKQRIRHGISTGKLTRSEARFLRHEQHRIRRLKKMAWTDGRLTRKERRRIEMLQNQASWHIYLLKHNPRHRYRGYRY